MFLKNETIININIAPNNSITTITNNYIYFFSPKGKLNSKLKNTYNLNIIDSTLYSDFILGSKQSKKIHKFTQTGNSLFSQSIFELKNPPSNLNIYKPYGDFVVFNSNEGAYYSMKTSIKINSCSQSISKKNLSVSCKINLTFPSTVEAKISNSQNQNLKLKTHKLSSGDHILLYKNIPLSYQNSSIEFLTKGLYSNQDIIKQTYNLNVKK